MLDLKTITHNINLIRTAGIKLDQRVHDTATSIMSHAANCGDFGKMNTLYEALPKSARRLAFVAWVVAHTPLKFDDKVGMFMKVKKSTKEYDVDGAVATPFWEFSTEMVRVVDVDKIYVLTDAEAAAKYREQEAKKLDKAIEAGHITGNVEAAKARLAGTVLTEVAA